MMRADGGDETIHTEAPGLEIFRANARSAALRADKLRRGRPRLASSRSQFAIDALSCNARDHYALGWLAPDDATCVFLGGPVRHDCRTLSGHAAALQPGP